MQGLSVAYVVARHSEVPMIFARFLAQFRSPRFSYFCL